MPGRVGVNWSDGILSAMALDLGSVGSVTAPTQFDYSAREVALYALGIGAKRDELDYLYEGRGPRVYPSFAVIPAWPALVAAMNGSGVSFDNVVHGHQKVTVARPLPPKGRLHTTAKIEAVYDLKRMAQVVVTTRTVDDAGEHLVDTEWGILVLGEGGFGGEPPPAREGGIPSRPSDWRVEESTTPEQALLYRLMGDGNPLHADPEFRMVVERFGGRPILHGLCSYGFLCRAVVKSACGGDASRLTHLAARFTKPVWPGDTLITEGWTEGEDVRARTVTRERGEAVLSHCTARVRA